MGGFSDTGLRHVRRDDILQHDAAGFSLRQVQQAVQMLRIHPFQRKQAQIAVRQHPQQTAAPVRGKNGHVPQRQPVHPALQDQIVRGGGLLLVLQDGQTVHQHGPDPRHGQEGVADVIIGKSDLKQVPIAPGVVPMDVPEGQTLKIPADAEQESGMDAGVIAFLLLVFRPEINVFEGDIAEMAVGGLNEPGIQVKAVQPGRCR